MSFLDLARRRWSVRAFTDRPISDDDLTRFLEAARLAPSAANRQPVRLVVVHTSGREAELRRVYDRQWFVEAPVVVCACVDPTEAWVRADGRSYRDVDAALVVDHLTLAAAEAGVGSCWVAAFDPEAARAVLGLPESLEPVAFVAIGYPAGAQPPKQRRPLGEFVRFERW